MATISAYAACCFTLQLNTGGDKAAQRVLTPTEQGRGDILRLLGATLTERLLASGVLGQGQFALFLNPVCWVHTAPNSGPVVMDPSTVSDLPAPV